MPSPDITTRSVRLHPVSQMMLFASLIAWSFLAGAVAASAANGLAFRLRLVYGRGLLESSFRLFLLVLGFVSLQRLGRQRESLEQITALARRQTAGREWLTGAALGWGIAVAAVLPLMLIARLHAQIAFGKSEVAGVTVALVTAAVVTLTNEITFRGYPFRCLTRVMGSTLATAFMVLGAGLSAWHRAGVPESGILASMLLTLLLSLSWLRTHAIWLAWGLHFALVACTTILFGLPMQQDNIVSTMILSRVYGPTWLTGGQAGPLSALFALLALAGALVVLYRLTRDYAWTYTHAPIVSAGAAVIVSPPAAHTAMEQAAAPALIQILSTTPTTFSTVSPQVVSPEDQKS